MNNPDSQESIQIDLWHILRSRLGKRGRYLPHWLVRPLEKIICQDRMNELLRALYPRRGADFCTGLLDYLGVSLRIEHQERLPENPRCIFVSNHPLGGLDGITMIAWLRRHYGCDVHFLVNDLLMAVEPLRDCFIPVNKHGAQCRANAEALDCALAGNDPVVIYPAGLVSRRGKDGMISDLKWHKMFINKAVQWQRDIVPVHFGGQNTPAFYRVAQWRTRLHIPFNIEMIMLPGEMFRRAGSSFTLTCGMPVDRRMLKTGPDAEHQAAEIRRIVYSLVPETSEK